MIPLVSEGKRGRTQVKVSVSGQRCSYHDGSPMPDEVRVANSAIKKDTVPRGCRAHITPQPDCVDCQSKTYEAATAERALRNADRVVNEGVARAARDATDILKLETRTVALVEALLQIDKLALGSGGGHSMANPVMNKIHQIVEKELEDK